MPTEKSLPKKEQSPLDAPTWKPDVEEAGEVVEDAVERDSNEPPKHNPKRRPAFVPPPSD